MTENISEKDNTGSLADSIPKIIFIVPYRDRELQKNFFLRQMKYVLEDMDPNDYKLYLVHQCDTRTFNRGAIKNIGFLAMRKLYPNDYQNITFVFNDVDTMPFVKNFFNYQTTHGSIKHFYGFHFALGGIISITGRDFERINGFPNFWAWGFEDNLLNQRAIAANIKIDRSQFYPIYDKHIIQLSDGLLRSVNRSEFVRYAKRTNEGWASIHELEYSIDDETNMINVAWFNTGTNENKAETTIHDLKKGNKPFPDIPRSGRAMNFTFMGGKR
jgi:hypothetical protein